MVRVFWILLACLLVSLPAQAATPLPEMSITLSTPQLNIKVRYPTTQNAVVDKDIAEWARQLVESFQAEAANADEQARTPYELDANYSLTRPSTRAFSVVWEVATYTGGAHGDFYFVTNSYALPAGTVIELYDLFDDFEKALNLLSKTSYRQLAASLGDGMVEEMLLTGTKPEAENFANFALTPEGLRIYFPPYQVAPWAMGPQQVNIPLAELETVGVNKTYW